VSKAQWIQGRVVLGGAEAARIVELASPSMQPPVVTAKLVIKELGKKKKTRTKTKRKHLKAMERATEPGKGIETALEKPAENRRGG
jgi:hypothetical protein